ncbi:MAG: GNAT family N-acetyltransferase [Propionicimonas sp.]|uniref:GNAT family N-acetyltransferase n=1 Tax=Propionicimonas sp. TaxID=1955623 RepID=UPI003D11B94C
MTDEVSGDLSARVGESSDCLVRTDRLVARRFVPSDVDAALAYLGDPAVMEFIEPCFDRARAAEFIKAAGMAPEPLVWAVELRSTGHLIGHVIFHPWAGSTAWELGWILRQDAWGKGYATELSAALIEYGFSQLGIGHIIAEAVPTNHASIAAIERAGITRSPDLDKDLPVWSIHNQ